MDLIDPFPYNFIDGYQPFQTVKPMVDTHVYDTDYNTDLERFLRDIEDTEASRLEEHGFGGLDEYH